MSTPARENVLKFDVVAIAFAIMLFALIVGGGAVMS